MVSSSGRGTAIAGNKRKVANAKKDLPEAPFRLGKSELRSADQRGSEIMVPVGFGWKPGPFFVNYSHMKAHDWKEVKYIISPSPVFCSFSLH